jgi:hypothetical protein
MNFPFRAGLPPLTFSRLVDGFRATVERFPDESTGENVVYSMVDAAIGAFSVFFTQSPSFLDFQRNLELRKGCSNARSLFGMTQTPSDNQIRNLLDPVPPSTLFPLFSSAVEAVQTSGHLAPYRSINGDLLVAMDGTHELRHFVSTAHKKGLAVIVDVVYNHAGPGDNSLRRFDDSTADSGGIYFDGGESTYWGKGTAWWKREVQDLKKMPSEFSWLCLR